MPEAKPVNKKELNEDWAEVQHQPCKVVISIFCLFHHSLLIPTFSSFFYLIESGDAAVKVAHQSPFDAIVDAFEPGHVSGHLSGTLAEPVVELGDD